MKNSDLKRFYKGDGIDPKDFVRLGQDGKIPEDLLPETGGTTILELSNVSGTLTDEQYELASDDNCIITLGTQRYYKMYDAATLIVYQTATRQAGQDSALYEYIEITKATKEWEYKEDNIVAANPTLEGTEAELTGIEIGKTKYKIPSGGGGAGGHLLTIVAKNKSGSHLSTATIRVIYSNETEESVTLTVDDSAQPEYTTIQNVVAFVFTENADVSNPIGSVTGTIGASGTATTLNEKILFTLYTDATCTIYVTQTGN